MEALAWPALSFDFTSIRCDPGLIRHQTATLLLLFQLNENKNVPKSCGRPSLRSGVFQQKVNPSGFKLILVTHVPLALLCVCAVHLVLLHSQHLSPCYFPEEFVSCRFCECSTWTGRVELGVSWALLSSSIGRYTTFPLNTIQVQRHQGFRLVLVRWRLSGLIYYLNNYCFFTKECRSSTWEGLLWWK